MENYEKEGKGQATKSRTYCNGIVRLPPRPPKSDEEIERMMEEMHEAQFSPNVKHIGRRGNIVQPLD
jgi:hypothetical protein